MKLSKYCEPLTALNHEQKQLLQGAACKVMLFQNMH